VVGFSDHLAGLDAAILEHVTDGVARVLDESGQVVAEAVHPMFERPTQVDTLRDAGVARAKPTLEIAVVELALLKAGYTVELGGHRYKVQGAPTRPGDGRWWVVDVQDLGPI
jgi:hypothetical protein